jgi:hypothetical protein
VKCVQCVKIWMFLKCVQFLKSYVQLLMDSILNLVIVQFLMKKRETHPSNARVVSEEKGDAPTQRASRISETCFSLLLTCTKKISIKYSIRCSLRQHATVPIDTNMCVFVSMDTQRARRKKHYVEHKLSDIIEVLRLS